MIIMTMFKKEGFIDLGSRNKIFLIIYWQISRNCTPKIKRLCVLQYYLCKAMPFRRENMAVVSLDLYTIQLLHRPLPLFLNIFNGVCIIILSP
jgi:hypothetical protein